LYSLACTFQQNDLKRKLDRLTSEAAKTRKKFEETLKRIKDEKREANIRQSQETLNESTKAGKRKKKTTAASKTKRANKKKTAAKKKTAPETSEEEDTSLSLSSEDETTKKTTSKKMASDKTASKKASPKKKTASKPAEVIDTTSLPSEDDHEDPEGAPTIKKHSYDKKVRLYTVCVSWKKSKKVEWQFLHDMWVDYPEEVKTYRDQHRLTASAWRVPNIDGAKFVVRILSMNGPMPQSATFCILFDNGYVEKEVGLANVKSDAPELLKAFLHEREKETSS
jgi:hypothetical protein